MSLTRLARFARTYRKSGPQLDARRVDLNLQPGDVVEVRTLEEIFATLDEKNKLRGLGFFREMGKFSGRRFRVYKRLDRIVVETTGELRKMKLPTVLLEGVFCDGRYHGGCDRSCFCYWREAWLKRV
jgi:acetyl-CoA carboxylase carboxyltransferase component